MDTQRNAPPRPASRARRPVLALGVAGTAALVGVLGPAPPLTAAPGRAAVDVDAEPEGRLAATQLMAGSELRIAIPESDGVAAVGLNLTATGAEAAGFVAAYPCGDDVPEVSNLNIGAGGTAAVAAVVPLGVDGEVCVHTSVTTDLVVDLTGRFADDAGLLPLVPQRLADTRTTHPGGPRKSDFPGVRPGHPLRVPVAGVAGVPADASAVAVNVTVGIVGQGHATVLPCDTPRPPTSNVNYGGAPRSNLVVVEPGPTGEICVVTTSHAHVLVDLYAAFEADADLGVIPAVRHVDTRVDGSEVAGGTTHVVDATSVPGVPGDAAGVILNVTAVNPADAGHLTVYPCAAGLPATSNLNYVPGHSEAAANLVLVEPDGDGRVCVHTSADTHLLVDVLGWTGDELVEPAQERLIDTRTG